MKKQKTWENLEVGDEIVKDSSSKRYILGTIGKAIFVSMINMPNTSGGTYTKEEFLDEGYTIVQDKEEEVNKEEDLKKLIEETKQNIYNFIYEDDVDIDDLEDVLAKWKGVEVEKIKYIK